MKLRLGFLGLFVPIFLNAQPYKNVQIDIGNSYNGPEEPTIAISLQNQNVIVAGANINNLYLSKNGGQTWKTKKLKSRYGVWGDPCVLSVSDGRFLYFHLAIPKGKAYDDDSFLDRIACEISNKKGSRFSKSTFMGHEPPKDQDKEWAVYDIQRKRTYVSWTQFDTYGSKDTLDRSVILASFSDDEGKNWAEPVVLSTISGNCIDDDHTTEGAVPAIGQNGEMVVAWGLNEKIYFNHFVPGEKVLKEVEIARQPGGWNQDVEGINRTNGMPVTVSDQSQGPHRGTIYVCWADQRNGELNTDVFLISSTDNGQTWSNPVRVNTDYTQTHQFLPWMTVDPITGHVYVLFYDRRNFTDMQTEVTLAISKDGGTTFSNEIISETPFLPNERVFFGDYINISAVNGIVRPIWTRYQDGKLSIWTALINFNEGNEPISSEF